MNLGIIGYGAMGKTHAYAVAALPYYYDPLPFSARVRGICTTAPARTEAICAQTGFEVAYETVDEMLADPLVDAICVTSPNLLHFSQVKAAMEAGKHVACEKPLCVTEAEGWTLARMQREHGLTGQVIFQNRCHGAVMKAKALIDEGRLGRILSFRFSYLHASCVDPTKRAGWKQDARIGGGGVLYDLGSHVIDLCYHLLGEFEAISGQGQIGFPLRKGMNGEDWHTNANEAFYMTARMKGGAMGTIEASKLATGETDDLSFAIYGERGAVKFSLMDPHFLAFADLGVPSGLDGFVRIPCGGRYASPGGAFPSPKAPCGWLRGHVGSLYSFLLAISKGEAGSPSFAEGAYVGSVMARALESDQKAGEMVAVPSPQVLLC